MDYNIGQRCVTPLDKNKKDAKQQQHEKPSNKQAFIVEKELTSVCFYSTVVEHFIHIAMSKSQMLIFFFCCGFV